MKLFYFLKDGKKSIGCEENGKLAVLTPGKEYNIKGFIENYDEMIKSFSLNELKYDVNLEDIKILLPYDNPQKIICIGQNYADHCREQNVPLPEIPISFAKYPTALLEPFGKIIHPKETTKMDFEGELAVIIGKRGKRIKKEEAYDYIFGYSIMNDISARDLQYSEKQWVRSKSLDTFAPFGPCIITKDEIPDPMNMPIRTYLNNQLMQDSSTKEMIFDIPFLMEFISRNITLFPGDIISTGTPHGVGHFRKPPVYMKDGDTIRIEIEGIGKLENYIIAGN
jgi:2-keto-4-pentenoate hydratase/2-oxohepta-3-ene-1,7-dioic acid hydratase in catechol pathway